MGVFDSVGNVIAGMKKVSDIAQKLRDVELQGVIIDLSLGIIALKEEMAKLREENLHLQGKINEMEKKTDIRSKLVLRNSAYYLTEPVQGYSQGPFCMTCMDEDGLLMSVWNKNGFRHCGRCINKRFK